MSARFAAAIAVSLSLSLSLVARARAGAGTEQEAGTGAPAGREGPTPAEMEGHAVPGWYLGTPVLITASFPDPGIDQRTLPSMRAYVTAPISDGSAAAPTRRVPRPEGEVVLPPHQITLSRLPPAERPLLAIGYFVEIAAEADAERVRVQPQPEDSWPRRPLASAIRVGDQWVPLNNQLAIEYGLASGLLSLEFFDVGGLMSARFFDGEAERLGSVELALETLYPAPPVGWAGDRDYRPGQLEDASAGSATTSAGGAPPQATNCIACHGEDGVSPNEMWPNLAGQQRGYLRAQLRAFRSGERQSPLMTNWVRDLSDADIDALADYYSELPAD